ncbi:matrix metalloproteinase-19-like, partial [Ostrea edulis]|uniref:matrix metalloproteinase-19-like n=1 Tax=Ostrea edulis TaxID=37623 RepID=UPI0024AFFFF6
KLNIRFIEVLVWRKDNLTWGFEKYSRRLRPFLQWKTFQKALRIWSKHSSLRFRYSRENPDIQILFARLDHGDGAYNAFDGQGSTLAHAFKPSNGGTHFDDDERWTLASENSAKDQIHLPTVVLHEIGHTLGLGHSSDYTSVMSPFFTTIKTKLTPVDISMLRALYGQRRLKPPERKIEISTNTVKPPTKEEIDNAIGVCEGISDLTTVRNRNRQVLHIFGGNLTFRVSSSGRKLQPPRWTSSLYNGVPGDVDAVSFYKKTRTQYFFKGHNVWKVIKHRIAQGYPKTVKMHTLHEVPRASVTVTIWHSSRIFIFGTHTFWDWNPWLDDVVTKPKPIHRYWHGLPDNIDAAMQWRDQYVYFFKGLKYYKVHPSRRMVMSGYPKPMPPPWLKQFCHNNGR